MSTTSDDASPIEKQQQQYIFNLHTIATITTATTATTTRSSLSLSSRLSRRPQNNRSLCRSYLWPKAPKAVAAIIQWILLLLLIYFTTADRLMNRMIQTITGQQLDAVAIVVSVDTEMPPH
uniref:Uncharacterized protein n=1 Tax=Glossina pallidipes TaxID=7398 RepID=A0A1A9ZTK3_GLOPL